MLTKDLYFYGMMSFLADGTFGRLKLELNFVCLGYFYAIMGLSISIVNKST